MASNKLYQGTNSPRFRMGFPVVGQAVMTAVLLLLPICAPTASSAQSDRDPAALFDLAQDAHEKGDLPNAIKFYREAIAVFPDFPEAHLQLGNALRQSGDSAAAEQSLRKALELRADWDLPLISLASLLADGGRFDDAEILARRAAGLGTGDLAAWRVLAEVLFNRGADVKALGELLAEIRSVKGEKMTADLLATRAALERATGDLQAARRSVAAGLAAEPGSPRVLAEAVEVALASNDIESGLAAAARLLTASGRSDGAVLAHARVLAAAGQFEKASAELDRLSRQTAASRELRAKISTVTSTDPEELETKLKSNPDDLDAVARLCLLYRAAKPERALEFCRLAVRSEPGNLLFAARYGAALLQTGRLPEATSVLQRLKKSAPDNYTVRANLAAALFQQKRWAEAREEYLWISETQPERTVTFYLLGIVFDELREYTNALASYRRFLQAADASVNGLEIEKVRLRLPSLERQAKEGKGR